MSVFYSKWQIASYFFTSKSNSRKSDREREFQNYIGIRMIYFNGLEKKSQFFPAFFLFLCAFVSFAPANFTIDVEKTTANSSGSSRCIYDLMWTHFTGMCNLWLVPASNCWIYRRRIFFIALVFGLVSIKNLSIFYNQLKLVVLLFYCCCCRYLIAMHEYIHLKRLMKSRY